MDAGVGDVIAFEVFGKRWSWRLGVIQAVPAPRIREVVVYRKKWAQMPTTARGPSGAASGNVVSDDEDEASDLEADLDATYVDNGKGKLRTILTSSIIFNLGDEEDLVVDDGKSIRLDGQQQNEVEKAIKNYAAGAMATLPLLPSIAVVGGEAPLPEVKERDSFGQTIIPKFKLNLPSSDPGKDEDPGYIAIPLPTGRAQNIYDNIDEDLPPEEKIEHLKAALFEYEGQIKSLIEQVETLRSIAGSKSINALSAFGGGGSSLSPHHTTPGGGILKGAGGYPLGPAQGYAGASPRKVRIATVTDTQPDPMSDMAMMGSTIAANSTDIEVVKLQLKSVTKQLSENRIKYEREMQALKDKNAELQSILEGWGAVAGTLYNTGAGASGSANALTELKNARETLHTARQTYRKTARKSSTNDTSGEEQLNAAEAFLDLQHHMVNFIQQAEGQRSARGKNTPAKLPTHSNSPSTKSFALAMSPHDINTAGHHSKGGVVHGEERDADGFLHPAPKLPTNRPAPLTNVEFSSSTARGPKPLPPAAVSFSAYLYASGSGSSPSPTTQALYLESGNHTPVKLPKSRPNVAAEGGSKKSNKANHADPNADREAAVGGSNSSSSPIMSPPTNVPLRAQQAASVRRSRSSLSASGTSPFGRTLSSNGHGVAASAAAFALDGSLNTSGVNNAGQHNTSSPSRPVATQKTNIIAVTPSPTTDPTQKQKGQEASPLSVSATSSAVVANPRPSLSAAIIVDGVGTPSSSTGDGLSPSKSATVGVADTPLLATTASGTFSGTTRGHSKPKAKPKPKGRGTAAASSATSAIGTAGDLAMEGSTLGTTFGGSVAGCGMSINSPSLAGNNLLSEFTRACGLVQITQRESDEELARLRQENLENAKKIQEMMNQVENMRKMRDRELEILRAQIQRLDAASERQRLSSSSPTTGGLAVGGGDTPSRMILDAKELITEDVSNMPCASPLRP